MLDKIFEAIKKNNIDELIRLKKNGGDFNVADKHGLTPAHWAACSGNPEMVRTVHEVGGDFNVADKHGQAPAHWAAESGNPEMVRAVHKAGGDFNAADKYGQTPAHLAALSGNLEMMKLVEDIANEQEAVKLTAARAALRAETEAKLREQDPLPDLGRDENDSTGKDADDRNSTDPR